MLDNHSEFLSVRQITDLLPNASFTTVKLACSELREEIEALYATNEIEFIVNPRKGIKLIRKGVNIQRLIEYMITDSISYKILCRVFFERQVNVLDFCQLNYISKSTLARQLKTINQTLNNHQMHISFSNRMSLKGEEGTIRLFLYMFLYSVHNLIDSIEEITKTQEYIHLTKQILYYLNIPAIENQIHHFAIFVAVISESIQQNQFIQPRDRTLKHGKAYRFPEKPFFLANWSAQDWQFFLLYLNSSTIASLDFSLEKTCDSLFIDEINLWIGSFEEVFEGLSAKKVEEVGVLLERQLQFESMFKMDHFLLEILEEVRIENMDQDFPEYLEHFNLFWSNLSHKSATFKHSDYLKSTSFLNSLYLVNLIYFNPKVRIYVFSDSSYLHKNFIENRINYHLSKYQVIFVNSYEEADIVASTVKFIEELTPEQQLVEIRSSLPVIDLIAVETAVELILNT